ncbi:MAG TPA: mycothiol synthase [Mycobacteriales bacterium]|nr:mycothiol synthase [Mycobacteriales bacterium]
MTEVAARIERHARLDPDEVRRVVALVDEVTAHDGVRPLSEHVMLHLRYGGDAPARNFLVHVGDELAGYGHLDTTDAVEGASAELAIAPAHRGVGLGRQLVEAIAADTDGRLRLWAHGRDSGAIELARSMGFRRERVLWQLRRSLFAPVPEPQWPVGVTVRTFVVGQDEEAWLRVNNRAFAQHPDQGSWTLDDVRMREQEPWFDAAGFFLAERDGELVGFHWTKVHGAQSTTIHGTQEGEHDHDHHHDPIGEVYVVGVDPVMQGQGLGPALTLRGLQHLRARGLSQVMLYVDETNTNAIRTYERLGFAKWDVDVCFLQQ